MRVNVRRISAVTAKFVTIQNTDALQGKDQNSHRTVLFSTAPILAVTAEASAPPIIVNTVMDSQHNPAAVRND